MKSELVYTTSLRWNAARPGALVVACSDGRLQEAIDDFLSTHLGITRYDRLYMPGGPGALATGGFEYLRSDTFRRECTFLVESHEIRDIILILHGSAVTPEDGPPEATCADYRRRYPRMEPSEIYRQQLRDLSDLLHTGFGGQREVDLHLYRCEVRQDGNIQFTRMTPEKT